MAERSGGRDKAPCGQPRDLRDGWKNYPASRNAQTVVRLTEDAYDIYRVNILWTLATGP